MTKFNLTGFSQIVENSKDFNENTLDKLPYQEWLESARISGDLTQWQKVIYKGDEVVGAVWYSKAGKFAIDGMPYEYMVFVLEGSVTLQPEGQESTTYKAGDMFFMRKDYKGTWEMPTDFKELIIAEKNAWIKTEGE